MKVLIVGTTYESTQERAALHDMWVELHTKINPNCDFLIVDSASPWKPSLIERCNKPIPYHHGSRLIFRFPNNLGHLALPKIDKSNWQSGKGTDGWGRAVCFALQHSIKHNYDYVVHIEGDSLCNLNVMKIAQYMQHNNTKVVSRRYILDNQKWIETGLVFFDVNYVKNSNLIAQYDWPNRCNWPFPEAWFYHFLGNDLAKIDAYFEFDKQDRYKVLGWRGARGDHGHVTLETVGNLDWITHCSMDCYEKFMELNLPEVNT